MVQKKVSQISGAILVDFESDCSTIAAGGQLPLQGTYQVVNLLIVDIQIAVSGYAKLITALKRQSWNRSSTCA
jgi:hypothetical protein